MDPWPFLKSYALYRGYAYIGDAYIEVLLYTYVPNPQFSILHFNTSFRFHKHSKLKLKLHGRLPTYPLTYPADLKILDFFLDPL